MKKTILYASLLVSLAIPMPGLAGMESEHHGEQAGHEMAHEHHHGDQAGHGMTGMDMKKMAASLRQMQEMREKITAAKEPAEQKALLRQHMQMMQDAMQTMTMMDEQCMKEHHAMHHGSSAMPMEERMKMLEQMMGHDGMMEKKMMLMREMLSGLLLQQEMLLQ